MIVPDGHDQHIGIHREDVLLRQRLPSREANLRRAVAHARHRAEMIEQPALAAKRRRHRDHEHRLASGRRNLCNTRGERLTLRIVGSNECRPLLLLAERGGDKLHGSAYLVRCARLLTGNDADAEITQGLCDSGILSRIEKDHIRMQRNDLLRRRLIQLHRNLLCNPYDVRAVRVIRQMVDADKARGRHKPEHNVIQPERIVQHAHGLLRERDHLPLGIRHSVAARLPRRCRPATECREHEHECERPNKHTHRLTPPSTAAHASPRPRR